MEEIRHFSNSKNLSTGLTLKNVRYASSFCGSGIPSIDMTAINDADRHSVIEFFQECPNLTSVKLTGFDYINRWTFENCPALLTVNLSDIAEIDEYAFAYDKALKSVSMANVGTIGYRTFAFDESLTSVTLHDVDLIASRAFDSCTALTYLDLSDVHNFYAMAFYNCSALETVIMPTDPEIVQIPYYSFRYCSSLTQVDLSKSNVQVIGAEAFEGGTSMTKVYLPHSIMNIQKGAFKDCPNITDVYYDGTIAEWNTVWIQKENDSIKNAEIHCIDGDVSNTTTTMTTMTTTTTTTKTTTTTTTTTRKTTTTTTTTTTTKPKTTPSTTTVTTVTVTHIQPENRTVISTGFDETSGFDYCIFDDDTVGITKAPTDIADPVIPDMIEGMPVVDIGEWTFADRTLVTRITVPDTVTSIGLGAFTGCKNLAEITLPDSVAYIGKNAFYNCTSLKEITLSDSLAYIGNGAFQNCNRLETVIMQEDSPTYIDECAFLYCSSLSKIKLSDSTTYIGQSSFNGCKSLSSIELPDSLTVIEGMFYDCPKLTDVKLPDSLLFIKGPAFGNCTSLKSITLPESLTYIDSYAFSGCTALADINIPESVGFMGESVFSLCGSLTEINIPRSVYEIRNWAFYDCNALRDVYYSGTEEEWNDIIISDTGNEALFSANIHCQSAAPRMASLEMPEYTSLSNAKTYTYKNAVPGTYYMLIAVRSVDTYNIRTKDNICYIDQQTADDNGSVTFNYTAPDDCSYVFIGDVGKGEYCRIVSDHISTDTDNCTICNPDTSHDEAESARGDGSDPSVTTTTIATTSVTTTTTTTTSVPPVSGNSLGDINNDGLIDAVDASLVLAAYARVSTNGDSELTDEQKKAADVNYDGFIDAVDASLILSYYAYISTSGTDTFEDFLKESNIV